MTSPGPRGTLHHLEIWVTDLTAAVEAWGWLLERLGHTRTATWSTGATWTLGSAYVVVESGPDVLPTRHERRSPGVNHVAFHGGTRAEVDALVAEAPGHGWSLLFSDTHPHAGGPDHYAAFLEDAAGHEVEIVAAP